MSKQSALMISNTQPVYSTEQLLESLDNALQYIKKLAATSYYLKKTSSQQIACYLVIGPTQSGKSTLLKQSTTDLKQVNASYTYTPFQIWNHNQMYYIEIPGYLLTTSKSASIWVQIIQHLTLQYHRQPIHGLILVQSIKQLFSLDTTALNQYALQLHTILYQFAEQYQTTLPVYLITTHTDLIKGFQSYFGHLSQEEQMHPFGFILESTEQPPVFQQQFTQKLNHLTTRLNQRALWRMEQTHQTHTVQTIEQFPKQISALNNFVKDLIALIFTKQERQLDLKNFLNPVN